MRLQVEAYGLLRFVTIVQNPRDTSITELKRTIELDIQEIYGWTVKVLWLKVREEEELRSILRLRDG